MHGASVPAASPAALEARCPLTQDAVQNRFELSGHVFERDVLVAYFLAQHDPRHPITRQIVGVAEMHCLEQAADLPEGSLAWIATEPPPAYAPDADACISDYLTHMCWMHLEAGDATELTANYADLRVVDMVGAKQLLARLSRKELSDFHHLTCAAWDGPEP